MSRKPFFKDMLDPLFKQLPQNRGGMVAWAVSFMSILSLVAISVFKEIVAFEAQQWWGNSARPLLFKDLSFKVPVWIAAIFLMVICIAVFMLVFKCYKIWRWSSLFGSVRMGSDGQDSRLPIKDITPIKNSTDVLARIAEVHGDHLTVGQFVLSIQYAVNGKLISEQVATNALREFGYQLEYIDGQLYSVIKGQRDG